MEEDIEIENKEEFMKQRNEHIRNGNYIEVDIVISKDEDEPISSNINIHGVSIEEIAKMIVCLDETKKRLEKQYPMASMMTNFLGIDSITEV